MLEWLKRMQAENNFDGPQLHKHWHEVMEPHGARDDRERFFAEVVSRAVSAGQFLVIMLPCAQCLTVQSKGGNASQEPC